MILTLIFNKPLARVVTMQSTAVQSPFGTTSMRLAALMLALVALVVPARGHSQAVFWDTAAMLGSFFPAADTVGYEQIVLTDPELTAIASRLGYTPRADWTVFVARASSTIVGYAIVDDELGQHEPITFGVQLSTNATVQRVEVMVYREPYGDEVRDARFRAQFVGRRATDPLRLGHEVIAVSGATISSASLVRGTLRAAALLDVVLASRGADLRA